MNHRSALHILTAKQLIKDIESSEDYIMNVWERRFLKKIKSDIASGLGLTTRESIKIHEIYRKSQRFFSEHSSSYYFQI